MLLLFFSLPVFACVLLLFICKTKYHFIRNFSLIWSLLILNFSFSFLFFYEPTIADFQLITKHQWLSTFNINFVFGLDGLGLIMILLTSLLIPTCVLQCWNMSLTNRTKDYCFAFFLLEAILFGVFSSLDVLLFYVLFEAVLIPMFLIIGFYGSRERRVRSAYLLFFYTLLSSLFMFLSILALFFQFGTTDYLILKTLVFDSFFEKVCWFTFFLSFAVKMPLMPFHIWLPEAHCEAPTAGSVILAGILLKLGGFGFLRYSIGLFPDASAFFTPFVFLISVLGIIYASLTTIQQIDLKKIIAYSSVGHMGVVSIGLFSASSQSVLGGVLLLISHGIVSGALFLCIGLLYERYHTRIIKYYAGLLTTTPLFSVFFILFSMANIGLPGTSSFVGEILIILGCFLTNKSAGILSATGMLLGGCYSLWLVNRLLFGNIKVFSLKQFQDLTRFEFFYLLPYASLTVIFGIFPETLICFTFFF